MWALSLALLASSSSSEPFTYSATGNAAHGALNWSMGNILPDIPGLDINGLIYRYRTVKNTEDAMKVHVSNLKAQGAGYIFRETDDWSGLPGNRITKSFALGNIPSGNWGNGSISVEGNGTVEDAVVVYSYRVDACYDPQLNPGCVGYVKPAPAVVEVEVYDALEDDVVLVTLDSNTNFKYDQDGNRIVDDEEEEKETRLEMGLTASANALTMLRVEGQSAIIDAINLNTSLATYYNSSINGGTYTEGYALADATLPDNARGLRNNLAQQLLHEEMVQMQYGE